MTARERQVRDFSLIWSVVWTAFAVRRWIALGGLTPGVVALASIGLAVAILGWLRPRAVRPLFSTAMALTAPINWVMNRVVLGLLFVVLFAPVGWLFRRLRRDALRLRKPEESSHWTPAPPPPPPESYLRQSL
jgi:hypothetical protein